MALYLLALSLFFFQINAQEWLDGTVSVLGANSVPVAQQTYNWNPEYRCRLLAHGSVVLRNDNHHVLVFDSGMAKYKYNWNGTLVEVLDLNGWTVTVDLSKKFNTQDFGILSQTKKAVGIPVLNRFGMWTDSTQNSIYIQGGHFYEAPGWNESQYHVNRTDIPHYSIWKFDLSTKLWTDVTENGNKKDGFTRSVGGTGLSVPELNKSFYAGGFVSSRSDPNAPVDLFTPLGGMLIYDHDTQNLYNSTYGSSDEQGFGFWHGSLNHMALGPGKGFLISLMGEKGAVGVMRPDAPGVNDETGIPVAFDYVLLYDLDKSTWYKQKTTFIDNDEPITRTRFCGVTIYSNSTNTWELWIYGGQLVDNKGTGVDDIYVLSMPSFIWTKVLIAQGENHFRTHTCHALGSQLLILGGYPPGFTVEPEEPCSSELIKVFDMNTLSWKSYYDLGTVYSTPQVVVDHAELGSGERRDPYLKPWADPALEAAFSYVPPENSTKNATQTPDKKSTSFAPWKIAVIVVCVVIALILIGGAIFLHRRRTRNGNPEPAPNGQMQNPGNSGVRGVLYRQNNDSNAHKAELVGSTPVARGVGHS